MEKRPYNGWFNYETWLCNLWYDGSFQEDAQSAYDSAVADDTFTREENAGFALADTIKNIVEASTDMLPENGFINDLITTGLQEINYHEIAKHYIGELKS